MCLPLPASVYPSVCLPLPLSRPLARYQNLCVVPTLVEKTQAVRAARDALVVPHEKLLKKRHHLARKLHDVQARVRAVVNNPQHTLRFLVPGRLVRIRNGDVDWGCV